MIGNPEFLETDITRYEILPRRRKSYGEVARKFHAKFPRGKTPAFQSDINANMYSLGAQLRWNRR